MPRIIGGFYVVCAARVVEERMPGVGIDLDVVRDLLAGQGLVDRASCPCGEIVFRIGAHYRAQSFHDLERPRIDAVERSDRLEAWVGASPRDREASAHA